MDPLEVAVFRGSPGWSFLATSPSELLCAPSRASPRPRLSALAIELETEAFQLGFYDGSDVVLFECTEEGCVCVSGLNGQAKDPEFFHGLLPQDWRAGFRLLQVADLRGEIAGEDGLLRVARALGGENARFASGDVRPAFQGVWEPRDTPPAARDFEPVELPADTLLSAYSRRPFDESEPSRYFLYRR